MVLEREEPEREPTRWIYSDYIFDETITTVLGLTDVGMLRGRLARLCAALISCE